MGIFDDLNQFLETRLDEFLRANPHLELQALEEQLREQVADTRRLITSLEAQQQQLQNDILKLAQDVKLWHQRIDKATAAGRNDLAAAARDREAGLLREGNQRWGQMQGVKQRRSQAQTLLAQVEERLAAVQEKAKVARASQPHNTQTTATTNPWASPSSRQAAGADPLEAQFQQWEMDDEIATLKREMGRE
ncbi:MAG: TIGR04376 family protein [Spirulinaceae cyanobacterium SM2_1_0]|nr:TIGR04376 family protein [Spirulinaceae cyanobacterium SM2_1_0]